MAEQVKVNIAESVDRIGSLPDEVLRNILSFLPTKVAFSTCVLSTRWRYLFLFSNNLDFDDKLFINIPRNDPISNDPPGIMMDLLYQWRMLLDATHLDKFMDFVDRCIMLMNTTHVDKFRLKCHRAIDASRVYSWICAAPLCNVRELDLCIPTRELGMEPLRVLTCSTLVVLKLGTGFSLNVPASVSLPRLKILCLDSIEFLDHISIQKLFSNCPVLEDLEIVRCCMDNVRELNFSSSSLKRLTVDRRNSRFCSFRLFLDAPSLVYLNYTISNRESYTLKNLHYVYEAHFSTAGPYCHDGPIPLLEFLKGISGVQSLSLSHYCGMETLMAFDTLPLHNNVTCLMLTSKPVLKLSVVMKLLHCFPNLEEFIFDGNIRDKYEDDIDIDIDIDVCVDVPPCVSSRLKAIEWKAFYYMESRWNMLSANEKDVETLEYFLKNANVLEKMWVRIGCRRRFQPEMVEKLKTMMETVKKPSRTCDVQVLWKHPLG